MDKLFAPLDLFYSYQESSSISDSKLQKGNDLLTSPLGMDLPENIQLVSLERMHSEDDGQLLVRLGHQFAVGEDEQLSQPVTIDLYKLLQKFSPIQMEEMTLSANQLKSVQMANKIKWQESKAEEQDIMNNEKNDPLKIIDIFEDDTSKSSRSLRASEGKSLASTTYEVTLHPMEIKTFIVSVKRA